MKKKPILTAKPFAFLLVMFLPALFSSGQITTSPISPTTICAGSPITVGYTVSPSANSGNVFFAQLSNAAGSFSSPVSIGMVTATASGNIAATIPASSITGTGYRIRVIGTAPATTGSDNGTDLTINALQTISGGISGPTDACPLIGSASPTTYSINPVAGAVSYTWSVPAGVTIVSGQGTNSLNVTFDNSFALTNSQFKVFVSFASGCNTATASLIVLKNIPGIPTAINGTAAICAYLNQPTSATYSVSPVQYATSYTWTVPPGATIVGGQGSTSVQVQFASPFSTGSIKVTANSNCGSRAPRSLSLTKSAPRAPTAIIGSQTVCTLVGTGTLVNYSIAPVSTASSYVWTVPANVTLMNGQGTTSVNLKFNTASLDSTVIKVHAVSDCGISIDKTIAVFTRSNSTPGAITGPTNACQYIGSFEEAFYSIRRVANATSYTWTVPAGATIASHENPPGIYDTAIYVTYDNSFVSGTVISVKSVGCITSSARNLTIVGKLPTKPGMIQGPANACEYLPSVSHPSGLPATYFTNKVPNATSYSWIAPADATIISHPAGTAENDTVVVVTYNSNFSTGTLSVSSVNGCGSSARTLLVRKLVPGTPGAITATLITPCPGRKYTYSLAAMPSNSTSVQWTIPAAGTLVSGQGTTTITVSYPATAVTGAVKATGTSNCGTSGIRTLNVSLPACPPARIMLSGKSQLTDITSLQPMSINIYPNPAVQDATLQVQTSSAERLSIKVFDMQGRLLKEISSMPGENIHFGNDLKPGIYFVEVTQGRNKKTEKLIKQ